MRPGSTVRPEASITSAPAGQLPLGPAVVTASIRPLSMCTTASRTGGAPVPSISMPARMIFIALLVLAPRSIARHRPTLLDTHRVGRVSHPRTSDAQSEGEDNMRATSQLRQLLKSGKTLFVPGCYNALSARILGDVGFPAIYMTGYGTSLALLGMPDAGLATMTEMHLNARYIANAVAVPVIADADNAYLDAGADLAFVEGPTSVEEVRRICREVKGPVFYNQTGVSPRFSLAQMQELGIAVTIIPGATFRATIEAVYDLAVALRDEGPLAEERFAERFKRHPLGDVHTFAGFDRIREWEAQYLPPEEAEKYADSVGHQPTRT